MEPDVVDSRREADRSALDRAVLEWMREARSAEVFRTRDDARFEALALAAWAHQSRHCEPYARLCRDRGLSPSDPPRNWREIPAVPTGAFKEMRIASFPPEQTCKVFRTSGTSGTPTTRRGELHLDTLELYETSLLASLENLLLCDVALPATLRVLAPPPHEADDSSLTHMFATLLAKHADDASGFDVRGGTLDADAVFAALDRARAEADARPVFLLGTAFSFVHLLDVAEAQGRRCEPLPVGSCAMETGGFKGRSREIERDELHDRIAERLGFAHERVVNQYGMSELGSQFYDSKLVEPTRPLRKLAPPWVRVRIVDPETGSDVPAGEPGIVSLVDLANTGSVCAIETADRGRLVAAPGSPWGDGFEVLGRQPGAEERGCSIAADVMLGGT